MEGFRPGLLLTISALAGLMTILSLMNWVKFEMVAEPDLGPGKLSFSVPGYELSRVRGDDYNQPADILKHREPLCSCRVSFGDGYVVAGLALLIVAAAGAGLFVSGVDRSVALVVVAGALGALAIAGYNALGKWQAIGAPDGTILTVAMKGSVRPELIALTALAALTAVLGTVFWAMVPAWEPDYEDDEEDTMGDDIDNREATVLESVMTWA